MPDAPRKVVEGTIEYINKHSPDDYKKKTVRVKSSCNLHRYWMIYDYRINLNTL